MTGKRLVSRLSRIMYTLSIVFLLTGMLLSAVSHPALAQEEPPQDPPNVEPVGLPEGTTNQGDPDQQEALGNIELSVSLKSSSCEQLVFTVTATNTSRWSALVPRGWVYVDAASQPYVLSIDPAFEWDWAIGPKQTSQVDVVVDLSPAWSATLPGSASVVLNAKVRWGIGIFAEERHASASAANDACGWIPCEWNPVIPADDPGCYAPCEWNPAIPADDPGCFALCEWNPAIPADDPGCYAPCEWNPAIPADDPGCYAPCEWNPAIPADDPGCFEPCGLDATIPASSELCVACEWNENILASDVGCYEPCEWNPAIRADDQECKPPQSLFNLTSMCKVNFTTGQMRVRNQSSQDYEYSLYRVGGSEVYTGIAAAYTDLLVEVPWYSSSDTWKLEIAGYSFTKAIGNNDLCNPPTQDQFNLTSMCKTTPATGQFRVRNQSEYEYAYTLYRYGGSEVYNGIAPAGADVLVEVPWYGSSDTWKLEIAGFTYTKAIGDNALCNPPEQSAFNLTSMCKIDAGTGQMRVRNQSEYDFAYKLYLYGGSEVYEGVAPAGTDVLVEVPWYDGGDTWKLEIAGYTFTKAIGNNQFCEPCQWDESLPASDPGCQVPQPLVVLSGSEAESCAGEGTECVTFTLEVSGLVAGKVVFSTETKQMDAPATAIEQEIIHLQTSLGEELEISENGIYAITVCGVSWPGVGFGFEDQQVVISGSAQWGYEDLLGEISASDARLYFDAGENGCNLADLDLAIQEPFCYATADGYRMAVRLENITEWETVYTVRINDDPMEVSNLGGYQVAWLGNLPLDEEHIVTVTWSGGYEYDELVASLSSDVCKMPEPPPAPPAAAPQIPVTAVEVPPAPVVEGGVLIPVTGIDLGANNLLGFLKDLVLYLGLGFLGVAIILQALHKRFQ